MPDRPRRAASQRRPARLAVGVALDGVRTHVSRVAIERLVLQVLRAEKARDALLSITLVSARRIAALNAEYLGHAGPTDVIAFAFHGPVAGPGSAVVGDIYIAPAVAASNARRFRVPLRRELERLAVHGTLHVLGWDHPDGLSRALSPMWTRQEHLLRAWRGRGAGR
jgi:probable rRNA maturation factor